MVGIYPHEVGSSLPAGGDPEGRFWWTAGLCRFEPGELDGFGVERL